VFPLLLSGASSYFPLDVGVNDALAAEAFMAALDKLSNNLDFLNVEIISHTFLTYFKSEHISHSNGLSKGSFIY
jgi:hypothetical protein